MATTRDRAVLTLAADVPPLPGRLTRRSVSWRGLAHALSASHVLGGLAAFVAIAFHAAATSRLGRLLPAGESPIFASLRDYSPALVWASLAGLAAVCTADLLSRSLVTGVRSTGASGWPVARWRPAVAATLELAAAAAAGASVLSGSSAGLAAAHTALQGAILLRVLVMPWTSDRPGRTVHLLDLEERRPLVIIACAFVLGAAPVLLDPGLRRVADHVVLDAAAARALSRALPPMLSGITAVWAAAALLVLLAAARAAWVRLPAASSLRPALDRLPFALTCGAAAAAFVASLAPAIAWELDALDLEGALPALVLVAASTGGALGHAAFGALAALAPPGAMTSRAGMLALALATAPALPALALLARRAHGRAAWPGVLLASLATSAALGLTALFGGFFNPWFTVFSYLKSFLFKVATVYAAGISALALDTFAGRPARRAIVEPRVDGGPPVPRPARRHVGRAAGAPRDRRATIAIAAALPLSLLPFAALERCPEAKAAILQFSEQAMVEAAYAKVLSRLPGLDRWIRLGQLPARAGGTDPWPPPWVLERVGPSLLPPDFNLVVVVVDALRGDAFRSAGYRRDLTPFLDRWAREDGVSFRRAYSQGGGTFAAVPFLIAGRSRLDLYGPGLHRENVYLKLAEAEGIGHVMAVHEFGPSALFPPHVRAIGPGRRRAAGADRSAAAADVLGWAREAIEALDPRERFFAYVHLLDVHNDLWKKAEGRDFGDAPRDLYDNNISYVDRAFARFVDWLRDTGRYERTVVVFTSDHGEQFWEHGASLHGHTLYEEDLRVPLILLAHGVRGRFEDVPVVSSDVVPTLVELAGYAVRPPYEDPRMGVSLVPLLRGGDPGRYLRRDVVGRASFKRTYFLYRNWRWKLTWSADWDVVQLFDTETDPGERRNLVREAGALAAELERELLAYLARVEGRAYRPVLNP